MDIKKNKNKAKLFFVIVIITSVLLGAYIIYTQVIEGRESSVSDLFSDYYSMLDDIGDPVSDPIIPTISQVNSWLGTDVTNNVPYEEDVWMCGEYSTMLVINAKRKNWRMYIVILYYSVDGGSGYGKRSSSGDYGHAFNMIYTQDGDDLDDELDVWYIEPQSDGTWQLSYNHYSVYSYYPAGSIKTIWDTIYWINYYLYF
ncbi:hypothetical protein LCGC14_2144120 [marine sediment metagenome]|uniref:Uncharacterized protein n=1 Tax=marine sediment metagenome TaxID=412755 RepID=A0A0F9EJR8_9ZZZZ